ncbi:MAG: hypothetical protein KAQ89_06410 [Planctomycetes bacterium]|nr:hypothetical protein [Planctomycetota bacterium]
MEQQKSCENCSTKNSCQDVYCEIGKKKGPSIVIKAVTALLLPMLVFIATLVATEKILKTQLNIENKEIQTIVAFLAAIVVTAIAVVIIKVINKKMKI